MSELVKTMLTMVNDSTAADVVANLIGLFFYGRRNNRCLVTIIYWQKEPDSYEAYLEEIGNIAYRSSGSRNLTNSGLLSLVLNHKETDEQHSCFIETRDDPFIQWVTSDSVKITVKRNSHEPNSIKEVVITPA
jgi:hypothetical protein